MDNSRKFIFSITDLNLNFNQLNTDIPISPIKIIQRGQLIGKLKKIKAPYDIWSYEIIITDNDDIISYLSELLDKLLPYAKCIQEASKQYERSAISCYIRSEFGQMGFHINNEIIIKLASLGLDIDFHILSFGGVKN
ncbi:DUF4279 domain-containing protein [Desulfitobacterium sp. THU1]|uniref:DUF4279 domain-containing protein n=1 Tax=Desulfitobacterium sp. THU1 TaxID=3138072 RepID=UPI00311D583B